MKQQLIDMLWSTTEINREELSYMCLGERIAFVTSPLKHFSLTDSERLPYYVLASKLVRLI